MADLLTVEQAAKQCGVSARTLRRANKAGKLHFCRLGQGPKTDRIRPQDLDAFIESCQSRNGRTEAIRYLSPSPVASRLESLIGDGRTRTRRRIIAQARDIAAGREPNRTIEDALERWLTDHVPRLRSARKVINHCRMLLPYIRNRPISDIPKVWAEIKAKEQAKAPATVNHKGRILRQIGNAARHPSLATLVFQVSGLCTTSALSSSILSR